jgi:ribosome biogenesis GTPase / thiamine phosphate phosphatase
MGADRLQGTVVATHGRHAWIDTAHGERLRCHARGKRLEVVVGDDVLWQRAGDEGVIEALQPRRNLLHRQDVWKTKSFAANLDQVLMVVSGEPMFSESQLARTLIAAHHAGIPAVVVLNKVDLPSAALAKERLASYESMGLPLVALSLKREPDKALGVLRTLLAGKRTLVMGASGMGKSSLINLVLPHARASVGEISTALKAGRHTTTHTQLYWLAEDQSAAVLDSPGFQEFGLHHLSARELAEAMPDLRPYLGHCRFGNCSHRHEPGCAVRQAVVEGKIHERRLQVYEAILAELEAAPRH